MQLVQCLQLIIIHANVEKKVQIPSPMEQPYPILSQMKLYLVNTYVPKRQKTVLQNIIIVVLIVDKEETKHLNMETP